MIKLADNGPCPDAETSESKDTKSCEIFCRFDCLLSLLGLGFHAVSSSSVMKLFCLIGKLICQQQKLFFLVSENILFIVLSLFSPLTGCPSHSGPDGGATKITADPQSCKKHYFLFRVFFFFARDARVKYATISSKYLTF